MKIILSFPDPRSWRACLIGESRKKRNWILWSSQRMTFSEQIIDILNTGQIEAIISERVLKEVQAYFKKFYDKDLAASFRDYLLRACTVIFSSGLKREMRQYKNLIKDKDLEQLAAVKKLGIKFLISYDRDFESFEEYITPKAFIKELGIKPSPSDY